ncbi:40S ribosomal protein S12, putative [Trypanosoma equiperdum]|uniref:40S ribosomal protein S12 n=4 Tax=Trypanozoon TaxID=39700 RepID=Q38AC1_TRYB2|nr:40S ribosomal protein S12, putative [Trypanosoma brucei gambiense DAL972]XP_823077.1 40S ribosomal protein S12, putative [Trypanosoma brucei brucei TREU927]RHW69453.1 40S ribosomal protein S12 [Trypanosoma brucei equiperdum]SCU70125.1 40S ribosomal protein S12, putative [Trypanosoma equiperdum]EAN78249.1 40S ribosomal protein S12, putative [Trypanosoma brucei brucei TREU927]CBH15934.1 40S ribosomal protein S12, putative [Trypanosoma brucei gambiense DAL972]|eukprot:XP_011778198.1 40S ribosomal protein S12, putative [Trypanosoma brucei gambiense DAL972]
MADENQVEKQVEPTPVVEVIDVEPDTLQDAIRIVIRKALEVNGLVRGLSEVARALDRRTAHMCILATDCDDEEYKKLIKALALQASIDIIEVDSREELAEWAGLQRRKQDETVKTFKCSCVAIRDFGERTKALDMLLNKLSH